MSLLEVKSLKHILNIMAEINLMQKVPGSNPES